MHFIIASFVCGVNPTFSKIVFWFLIHSVGIEKERDIYKKLINSTKMEKNNTENNKKQAL